METNGSYGSHANFENGIEPMTEAGALVDDQLHVTTMNINDDDDLLMIKWGGMMMMMTSQMVMML